MSHLRPSDQKTEDVENFKLTKLDHCTSSNRVLRFCVWFQTFSPGAFAESSLIFGKTIKTNPSIRIPPVKFHEISGLGPINQKWAFQQSTFLPNRSRPSKVEKVLWHGPMSCPFVLFTLESFQPSLPNPSIISSMEGGVLVPQPATQVTTEEFNG